MRHRRSDRVTYWGDSYAIARSVRSDHTPTRINPSGQVGFPGVSGVGSAAASSGMKGKSPRTRTCQARILRAWQVCTSWLYALSR